MDIDYKKQYDGYIGIDECARGNLFGPSLFVGVKLKVPYEELNFAVDSKTTKKSQRADMIEKIKNSVEYCLIEIPPQDIDSKGLSPCIKGALEAIKEYFGTNEKYLYDGSSTFNCEGISTLVKADGKVISVSCASIIAKNFLDILMEQYDVDYPEYGFIKNSGYGTKQHINAIKEHGYTPLHRLSYKIKELITIDKKSDFLF